MLYFCTMSRLLAIDYGQKRVGIAVTDDEQIIASALTTLHSKEVMSFLKDYLSKISDEDLYAYNVYQIEGEGRELFAYIEGDENTIMGLPIKTIKEYLKNFK